MEEKRDDNNRIEREMIEYINVEQGTKEWHNARCGVVTASRVKDACLKGDKIPAYAYEVASERITGRQEEAFTTFAMERGKEDEVIARDIYTSLHGNVEQVGLIKRVIHNGLTIGFSPDGLTADNGIIEIKSRLPKYQIETISKGEVPAEFVYQIQIGLLVSGRDYCDFISYSNGLPLFVKRVFPDTSLQAVLIEKLTTFEETVSSIVVKVKQLSERMQKTEYVERAYGVEVDFE